LSHAWQPARRGHASFMLPPTQFAAQRHSTPAGYDIKHEDARPFVARERRAKIKMRCDADAERALHDTMSAMSYAPLDPAYCRRASAMSRQTPSAKSRVAFAAAAALRMSATDYAFLSRPCPTPDVRVMHVRHALRCRRRLCFQCVKLC